MKLRKWLSIASLSIVTIAAILLASHSSFAQEKIAQAPQPEVCNDQFAPIAAAELADAPVGEVTSELGVARTGAHDDCLRLTPLPRGTRARIVSESQGPNRFKKIVPWYQLDYGAWIEATEVNVLSVPVSTQATLTGTPQLTADATKTEFILPLGTPVPLQIQQTDRSLGITLYNTKGKISQLNIQNPKGKPQQLPWVANKLTQIPTTGVINANWQNLNLDRIQINLQTRSRQQWGYQMAYRGNNLVVTLRQPPQLSRNPQQPLQGLTVVVDAGHGGTDSGAVGKAFGQTYMEKTVNIQISEYLQQELQKRGAKVVMTRTTDVNPSLDDRQVIINRTQPVVSISLHHDAGTPGRASGASIYWYHPHSQNFAAFMLDYFSKNGHRNILNNNGVIQRSFALARPSTAPAVLLEVGFMTNPPEITDLARPQRQQELAKVLANGISEWLLSRSSG
jgi:N-acetylmuramoyl-L-alanine amidase